jgi:hypothetical protein
LTQMRSLGFLHLWAPNSAEPGNNRAQGPGVRRVHRLSYTVPGPRSTITHSWGAPQILGKIPQNTPSWARETQSGVTERELATFSASLHPHTTWGGGAPCGWGRTRGLGPRRPPPGPAVESSKSTVQYLYLYLDLLFTVVYSLLHSVFFLLFTIYNLQFVRYSTVYSVQSML